MTADERYAHVVQGYAEHVNPFLAKLMNFAGFGVEDHAEGCWLWDHEGRKFLDCLGGYGCFSLGHRHPRVIEAVKAQLDLMPLSSKVFFGEKQAELATKLAQIAPGNLEFSFFCNSGAEAVEGALKFARKVTGRTRIISTHGGYHGKTLGALSVTGRDKYKINLGDLITDVEYVDFGDEVGLYRHLNSDVAAVIIEPIQGEGGIHAAPDGYLCAIRGGCTETGALMILDEVQTGLGRTGKMWGADWHGVEPDLMTLAKSLGGGVMPIGAVMGTPEVWRKVFGENPLFHTSTFGGNPLACAAGVAAIDVVLDEGLVERSLAMGDRMMDGLREVAGRHSDLVKEVRGRGLMIGVEFTMDDVGELVIGQMTKRGVIAAYFLNNPRVIRFEPPLIITDEEVDLAVKVFGESVAETAELLAGVA